MHKDHLRKMLKLHICDPTIIDSNSIDLRPINLNSLINKHFLKLVNKNKFIYKQLMNISKDFLINKVNFVEVIHKPYFQKDFSVYWANFLMLYNYDLI